jgi:capsular exopolysaccharide synthesis family protein
LTEQAESLITLTDPRSPISDIYRTLRTNLEFSSIDDPFHTLLVTSVGPGEGKSTTLANLAVVMADGEKKVILVDADLRRPSQHQLFGLGNERGLTSMFVEEQALHIPPLQATAVSNLTVLTSGPLPPIPSQLLGSRRMREVISLLCEQADVVLFDAPPVIAVADATLLASQVDGVLLVVRANSTKRDQLRAAKDRLERVNARLLGAALNNVPLDATLYRYYTGRQGK